MTEANGTDTPEGASIARSGAALLRGGTWPALAVGAVGTVASAVWGWSAVGGFAVGAVVAAGALAVGPALLRASRNASPPAVTAVAVAGYLGVVVVLGAVFAALGPLAWLSASHVAAALVAVTVAGLVGQIRAVTRLRVLTFGTPQVAGDELAPGPRNGDGAQSSQQAGR